MMKHGELVYDPSSGRMDICFDDKTRYGGLHCGECMYVLWAGMWMPTRIEMTGDGAWYLSGIRAEQLCGLEVRI